MGCWGQDGVQRTGWGSGDEVQATGEGVLGMGDKGRCDKTGCRGQDKGCWGWGAGARQGARGLGCGAQDGVQGTGDRTGVQRVGCGDGDRGCRDGDRE